MNKNGEKDNEAKSKNAKNCKKKKMQNCKVVN